MGSQLDRAKSFVQLPGAVGSLTKLQKGLGALSVQPVERDLRGIAMGQSQTSCYEHLGQAPRIAALIECQARPVRVHRRERLGATMKNAHYRSGESWLNREVALLSTST